MRRRPRLRLGRWVVASRIEWAGLRRWISKRSPDERSDIRETLIQDPAFRYALAGYLLLHGFIKKTQKNPAGDLELAHKRRKEVT
jgi:hypothetical protein